MIRNNRQSKIRQTTSKRNRKAGISLNEIIITTGVIGLLATAVFPTLQQSIHQANQAALVQKLRTFQVDMESVYLNQVEYPPEEVLMQGSSDWVAPTNLSAIQDLRNLITGLSATHTVTYTRPSGSDYVLAVRDLNNREHTVTPKEISPEHIYSAIPSCTEDVYPLPPECSSPDGDPEKK